ncbi:MAG: MarR family transcriptional regulator [Candidatus Krumholzibacteriaceae bacterium]|jgi:DNA-binding MarR family transcriptional regulator
MLRKQNKGSPAGKASRAEAKDSRLRPDARDLQAALSELVHAYQFRDRKALYYYDISVTQCYALSSVVAHRAMTLNELAAELYLDKSTASRVVDALAEKGYVRRSRDRKDARTLRLEATAKGIALHSKISGDLVEEMRNLIVDDSPAVRRATIRLIARLARLASKKFGRRGPVCCVKK